MATGGCSVLTALTCFVHTGQTDANGNILKLMLRSSSAEELVLVDTHSIRYLGDDCAPPDLTVVKRGCVPTAFSAVALIELQV